MVWSLPGPDESGAFESGGKRPDRDPGGGVQGASEPAQSPSVGEQDRRADGAGPAGPASPPPGTAAAEQPSAMQRHSALLVRRGRLPWGLGQRLLKGNFQGRCCGSGLTAYEQVRMGLQAPAWWVGPSLCQSRIQGLETEGPTHAQTHTHKAPHSRTHTLTHPHAHFLSTNHGGGFL